MPSDPRSGTLPPALATWLDAVNALTAQAVADGLQPTPEAARQGLATLTRKYGGQGPELAHVHDARLAACPSIPLRLYDPGSAGERPLIIYLHGGGHMAGSIDVYDPIIRRVARLTGCRTLAIDYRLAPEHPYPQGLEDCLAVIRALQPGGSGNAWPDTTRGIILAGDSAGGALTASVAARSITDASLPIAGQILIYPSLDYTLEHPSIQTLERGYLLETDKINWYFDHYFLHNECRRAASPLHMPVAGLPPTLLFTGGFCPLRDEGYAYAARLMQAGTACHHENFPDMIHAWLNIHTLVPHACEQTYSIMRHWINNLPTPPINSAQPL